MPLKGLFKRQEKKEEDMEKVVLPYQRSLTHSPSQEEREWYNERLWRSTHSQNPEDADDSLYEGWLFS